MFWKHRNIRLLCFCLLASVLLSISYTYYIQRTVSPSPTNPEGWLQATEANNTTYPVTHPTYFRNTLPTQDKGTLPTGYYDPDSSPVEAVYVPKRSLEPFVQTVCLIAGLVLAGSYIFFKQEGPLFGPDADLCCLFFSTGVLRYWMNSYPSLETKLLSVILFMLLLTSIRGLLWWLMRKAPLAWSIVNRLALFAGKSTDKHAYLTVHVLACISFLICGVYLLIYGYSIEMIPFVFGATICMIYIWRFGKQADQVRKQISNLYENKQIQVCDGIFSEEITQLASLREKIDEAVQTAVTGERFKVELISNVSHDLRTPLTAILGYGELLQKESLSEVGQHQLNKLNQKAGYMRDLVDSVFEMTKVSSGSLPAKMERIDLIKLLEQTLGLFDDELKASALEVRRHYCKEVLFLETDGSRMHQVFANLVGNAVKYALNGSRAHLYITEDDNSIVVRLTNVSAYEMDFQPDEVIQRFVRGDKARSGIGNGIGLAIAQTYTQSVGGAFRVEIDGEQFSAIVTLPKTEREL